jgi:hypothetical protein
MSSLMFVSLGRVLAMTLVTQGVAAATGAAARAEDSAKSSQAQPARTAKERLGSKASDEQRADNCKVPRELRGAKPRPDCNDAMIPESKR